LVTRNPLEVAKSLNTRNKFPISFGLALWEKYVLLSLEHSLHLPRIHISHQQIIHDPVGAVAQLHDQLAAHGVEPLRKPSEREILSFIDPSLYRERVEADPLADTLGESQAGLFALLQSGEALRLSSLPGFAEASAALLRTHDFEKKYQRMKTDSRPLSKEEIMILFEQTESTIKAADARERSLRSTIENLHRKIDATEAELNAAKLWKSRSELFFSPAGNRRIPAPVLTEVNEGHARFLAWRTKHSAKVRKQAELEQAIARGAQLSSEEQARQYRRRIEVLEERINEVETRRDRDLAKLRKWADRIVQELSRLLKSNRWRLGCWLSLKRSDSRSKEAQRFAQLLATRPRLLGPKE
jgi:hypothetical protein